VDGLLRELKEKNLLEKVLYVLLLLYATTLTIFLIVENRSVGYVILALFLVLIQYVTNAYLHKNRFKFIYALLPIIEYFMIIFLFIGTDTGIESVVLVIFTIRTILVYPNVFSLIFSQIGYFGYLFIWEGFDQGISVLFINILSYSLVIVSVLGAKLLLKQRDDIKCG